MAMMGSCAACWSLSACMFAVEFLLLRLSKVYYLRMGIIL